MVGKSGGFSNLRKCLVQTASHESNGSHDERQFYNPRGVPIIASPLDPKATEWLKSKHESGNLTLKRRPTIAQYEAHRFAGGIFRKQHEASTLELFFDLFFVANLTVFTTNYEHSSGASIGNYIGFIGILWSTWFNYSIYDVRFYVDSMFNRFCKLFSFGVMVSLTALTPIYEVISNGGETRGFQGLSLVLMACRLMIMLQYITVLWFVRPFKKSILPLALMVLVYLCTAMAFLGTYLDAAGQDSIDESVGNAHVIVWYVIIGVEAVAVLLISSVWRVLSFKYTHLVERVGLLTLIVMGEGIIGCTKSVAYILQGISITIWTVLGLVIGVVLFTYLIYVLYFSPIDHDRFGTIRQQIWALLHFPLHVAILLAQEAANITLLWTVAIGARKNLYTRWPSLTAPSTGFSSADELVASVNETMIYTSELYTYAELKKIYDYSSDLKLLANIDETFNTTSYDEQAAEILSTMFNATTNFFLYNFNYEVGKKVEEEEDPNLKTLGYFVAERVSFTSFYIASGCILLLMALMYWIGKNNKTREEWIAIMLRVVVGTAIPFLAIIPWKQPIDGGFMYYGAGWIVSVVTLIYLFVLLVDDMLRNIMDSRRRKEGGGAASSGQNSHGAGHVLEEGKIGPRGPQPYKQSQFYDTREKTSGQSSDEEQQHTAAQSESRVDGGGQIYEERNSLMSENETLGNHHHITRGEEYSNAGGESSTRQDGSVSSNPFPHRLDVSLPTDNTHGERNVTFYHHSSSEQ